MLPVEGEALQRHTRPCKVDLKSMFGSSGPRWAQHLAEVLN